MWPRWRFLSSYSRCDRFLRISREENLLNAQQTTRTVVRGLAPRNQNPLGGIRGAAQLLERELPEGSLREYTGIIIQEADRLRGLVDRLLGPNTKPALAALNVHEVLEHVLQLIPRGGGRSSAAVARLRPQPAPKSSVIARN